MERASSHHSPNTRYRSFGVGQIFCHPVTRTRTPSTGKLPPGIYNAISLVRRRKRSNPRLRRLSSQLGWPCALSCAGSAIFLCVDKRDSTRNVCHVRIPPNSLQAAWEAILSVLSRSAVLLQDLLQGASEAILEARTGDGDRFLLFGLRDRYHVENPLRLPVEQCRRKHSDRQRKRHAYKSA